MTTNYFRTRCDILLHCDLLIFGYPRATIILVSRLLFLWNVPRAAIIPFPRVHIYLEEKWRWLEGSHLGLPPGRSGFESPSRREIFEVYPGLGILQPQWNPYPKPSPRLLLRPAYCSIMALSMVRQSVTTHGEVAGDLSSRTQLESDVNTVGLSFQWW